MDFFYSGNRVKKALNKKAVMVFDIKKMISKYGIMKALEKLNLKASKNQMFGIKSLNFLGLVNPFSIINTMPLFVCVSEDVDKKYIELFENFNIKICLNGTNDEIEKIIKKLSKPFIVINVNSAYFIGANCLNYSLEQKIVEKSGLIMLKLPKNNLTNSVNEIVDFKNKYGLDNLAIDCSILSIKQVKKLEQILMGNGLTNSEIERVLMGNLTRLLNVSTI